MAERPEFTHKRERHGVIGPFSGRQLVFAFAAVIVAGVVLVGITTPLGNTANAPGAADPRPTAYILERYRGRGLELVAISVQETSPADVASYAARYGLGYTIGFDGSGKIFHAYKGFGLPTQVFIDENGVIASIVGAPLDEAGAMAQIEAILPRAGGTGPSLSPSLAH